MKKIFVLIMISLILCACKDVSALIDRSAANTQPTSMETASSTPMPAVASTQTPTPVPAPTRMPTIAPTRTPPSHIISCLFIGDSTTQNGGMTQGILDLQETADFGVVLLGTRGTAPNLHEGRSGWRASDYTMKLEVDGVSNAFFNPETHIFDFSYYMKQQKYKKVDYVFLNLGINDTFAFKDDRKLKIEISKVLNRYNRMIKSIHKFNKKIKIGVFLTIPPTSIEETFIADYEDKYSLKRYERNNQIWVKALNKEYAKAAVKNVYLIPVNKSIDRKNIKGVHPTPEGYRQIALTVWNWLTDMEQRGVQGAASS